MDFNRNQFFFMGILILLVGLQVRAVRTYVLTPETTRILAEWSDADTVSVAQAGEFSPQAAVATVTGAQKTIEPPEWLGWCLMSIGAVLVLHSLAMPKPGG
jgi:hypothetical protein